MTEAGAQYKGYIFSRAILGNIIPQRVQNTVVRQYATKRGLTLVFSAAEYVMANCFMILRAELAALDTVEGLVFYSLHQLPTDRNLRAAIIDSILFQGKKLHFALEEMVVQCEKDVALIEDIFLVLGLSKQLDVPRMFNQSGVEPVTRGVDFRGLP